mmetsp:Transcript_3063/g.12241  ORF Transcript_3063/g.12241 Transcript_3063/m.12241 type:complete len:309 (-) Transcript_3063:721-1647(-)
MSFMSWNLCSGFFTVTPMNCCCSGHGRNELSNTNSPFAGFTRRNDATSSKLGSVAERPTSRTISCVCSTCRTVRATMDSNTGPRVSCSRWISSMISRRTSCVYVRSPDLRVMMSHFSGVVTMTCVSSICARDNDTSPVSSRTFTPYGLSLAPRLPTISATSAFMGATYTILNAFVFREPSGRRCEPISCRIVSIATFVLPAPVGAHSSMFSGDSIAVSYTWLCTRFRVFIPANAGCAQEGSSSMGRSFSASVKALGFSAGMCTSSYPFFALRYDPAGSSQRLLDMKWLPCANASASSSSILRPAAAAS